MTTLDDRIHNYFQRYYRDTLGLPNWNELANNRQAEEQAEERRVDRLESLVGKLQGKDMCSVGCGTGGFAVIAHARGARVSGFDPDREAVSITKAKVALHGMRPDDFLEATAERIPFPDASFDIVHCYTVLEHVEDVTQSMREMIRIARPDGAVYIHSPNALHAYEGHYKIFWPPLIPKWLGRRYLAFRGRPGAFLDTLNYLTPTNVRRIASRLYATCTDVAEVGVAEMGSGMFGRTLNAVEGMLHIKPHIEVIVRKQPH